LLRSSEYEHVAQQGRRALSSAFVVLVAARPEGGPCRLGITASRKVGGAVVRNRIKRRIREWFRGTRAEFPGAWDILVIARQPATDLGFGELCSGLSALVGRAVRAS
jgi:ribonuclease P protein component